MEKPLLGTTPEWCTFIFKRRFTFFLSLFKLSFWFIFSDCHITSWAQEYSEISKDEWECGATDWQRSSKARWRWCFQAEGEKAVSRSVTASTSWAETSPGMALSLIPQATTSSPNSTSPRMEAPSSAGKGTGCAFLPHQVSRSTFYVSQGRYQGWSAQVSRHFLWWRRRAGSEVLRCNA